MKRWVYNLLLIVFCAVFLCSVLALAGYFLESRQQAEEFDQLASLVQQAPSAPSQPTEPGVLSPTEATEATEPTAPPLVAVTDPKTGQTISVLAEYAEVYTMNSDLVGWIQIDDTRINYPVMQSPHSPDYYLKRSFSKEYSSHGCIYAREVCDIFAPSDNITLYGHNMKDSSMFADLFQYRRYDFWQTHRTFRFDTISERHTYAVLAVFVTTASEGKGFHYHRFVDAADPAEFDDFVDAVKSLALFDTGVDAEYGDKLLTLSTCEYSRTNGRLVVAKRISE